MRRKRIVLVLPLVLLLMAASCDNKVSVDNSIKATAALAATNRAASDLVDNEQAAGRIDKATRDAYTVVFKEVARLDDAILDTLEAAKTAGVLSVAARQSVVSAVNQMRLRITAGTFPFIKNPESQAAIAAKIKALTDTLDLLLSVLPTGK